MAAGRPPARRLGKDAARPRITLALPLACLLSSCQPIGADQSPGSGGSVDTADQLSGTAWVLENANGRRMDEARPSLLRFTRGRVTGRVECTMLEGRYRNSRAGLEIEPLSATPATCALTDGAQAALRILTKTTTVRPAGVQMLLISPPNFIMLRRAAQ